MKNIKKTLFLLAIAMGLSTSVNAQLIQSAQQAASKSVLAERHSFEVQQGSSDFLMKRSDVITDGIKTLPLYDENGNVIYREKIVVRPKKKNAIKTEEK